MIPPAINGRRRSRWRWLLTTWRSPNITERSTRLADSCSHNQVPRHGFRSIMHGNMIPPPTTGKPLRNYPPNEDQLWQLSPATAATADPRLVGSYARAFQLSVAGSYSHALLIGTHAGGPDCGNTNPPNA